MNQDRGSARSHSPNRLLARLPADDYERLLPSLENVHLQRERVLVDPHLPVRKIYFPGGGLSAITIATAAGESAGVAYVGNEGVIGLTACGVTLESAHTAVVEIAGGDAQVMDYSAFERAMGSLPAFEHVIHLYAQAFMQSLMQSVACNALHPIDKRCARCLLDIADRIGGDELPVTHDLLATMLGVRRASVTLATGALHRAGLIDNAPRRIRISDRSHLEAAACECYAVIKAHFFHLLP
jgi:CRP-like cAMP-binding protein